MQLMKDWLIGISDPGESISATDVYNKVAELINLENMTQTTDYYPSTTAFFRWLNIEDNNILRVWYYTDTVSPDVKAAFRKEWIRLNQIK